MTWPRFFALPQCRTVNFAIETLKVVSQHSWLLAPMAVEAVRKIIDPTKDDTVDLRNIKIVKKLGETVEESQMIEGALFDQVQ